MALRGQNGGGIHPPAVFLCPSLMFKIVVGPGNGLRAILDVNFLKQMIQMRFYRTFAVMTPTY